MSFWRLFVLVSLPLLVLDFATKEWTVRHFADPEHGYVDTLPVIPGFFDLVRVHNTGVAFGMANKTAGACGASTTKPPLALECRAWQQ